jgi:hypothetical protein
MVKLEQSGMTFTNGKYCPQVYYGTPKAARALTHLATTGANWVSIVVTQYQKQHNTTEIFPLYTPQHSTQPPWFYTFITATEQQLRSVIRDAKMRHNIKVMLKPHIDLTEDAPEYWRGDIGTGFSASDWDRWFESYEKFILTYARLAEEEQVELLSLSCELIVASEQEAHWRALIPKVRKVYKGMLTDAANWAIPGEGGEVADKKWWDAVDMIGVDEYYPFTGQTVQDLVVEWQPIISQLRGVSLKFNKTLIFTEIGYCSGECQRGVTPNNTALASQAIHFEAALTVMMQNSDWVKGVYWWNWPTDPAYGGPVDDCMAMAYKPVESVLRKYYRATQPIPPKPDYPPACLCTL